MMKMKKKIVFAKDELAVIKRVYAFARKEKAGLFLVGGVIRDKLLKRERKNPDIDFCLKRGSIAFGRGLARNLNCGFVVLDQDHGACRLVYKSGDKAYTLDFTDFRGPTIEEDLRRRDFTINSLALAIEEVVTGRPVDHGLIDLYGGSDDIRRKLLRLSYKEGFSDDPLRVLRAFSFSCLLRFTIEEKTLRCLCREKKKLLAVSSERIRDELFKILDSPRAYETLVFMDAQKILEIIMPEINTMRGVYQGPYHHLDIWKHTLESVKQFEGIVAEMARKKEIAGYLDEQIAGGRRRLALTKLALILHDIGKPPTLRRAKGKISFHGHERAGLVFVETICRRLKLSNEEVRAIKTMVLWHLRPGYLGDLKEITSRAIFRYFRDTAQEALAVLLLSMADQRATRGPLSTPASGRQHERTALFLIKKYFKSKKEKKLVRLVTGDDLIRKCGLSPSPLIGKILKELEELQAIGRLGNKRQAMDVALRLAKSAIRPARSNQKTSSK